MSAAPAHADQVAKVTVTVVSPDEANSLLSLCITSRSLDPNGTCIDIG